MLSRVFFKWVEKYITCNFISCYRRHKGNYPKRFLHKDKSISSLGKREYQFYEDAFELYFSIKVDHGHETDTIQTNAVHHQLQVYHSIDTIIAPVATSASGADMFLPSTYGNWPGTVWYIFDIYGWNI